MSFTLGPTLRWWQDLNAMVTWKPVTEGTYSPVRVTWGVILCGMYPPGRVS